MQPNQNLKENVMHGTPALRCAFYHSVVDGVSTFVPHHWHDELELIYFRGGRFRLEVGMQAVPIDGETLVFLNAGELHSIASQGFGVEDALVFDPMMLSFDAMDAAQTGLLQPLAGGRLLLPRRIPAGHVLFAPIREEFERITSAFCPDGQPGHFQTTLAADDLTGHLFVKSALLRILGLLYEHAMFLPSEGNANRKIDAVKSALRYIGDHYQEQLYIGDLAALAGMNEQYFCRFFKSAIGRSPMEYVNFYRCKQAARLLRDTDKPVMDICLDCGFNNLGNFLKTFKRHYGATPLQYRKAIFKSK
ncbi:MAG: AraC family transcriptional regulator [Butyricicoccus sp.]